MTVFVCVCVVRVCVAAAVCLCLIGAVDYATLFLLSK